jgi:hypothetical protein
MYQVLWAVRACDRVTGSDLVVSPCNKANGSDLVGCWPCSRVTVSDLVGWLAVQQGYWFISCGLLGRVAGLLVHILRAVRSYSRVTGSYLAGC